MQFVVCEPAWYVFLLIKLFICIGIKTALVWSEKFSPVLPGREVKPVPLGGKVVQFGFVKSQLFQQENEFIWE